MVDTDVTQYSMVVARTNKKMSLSDISAQSRAEQSSFNGHGVYEEKQ